MSHAYLKSALENNTLPSTLLFSGGGTRQIATELASQLLGCSKERIEANSHPDFHALVPEGKSALHSIESIREAIGQSHESPFEDKASVFLIECAERMQPAAANALLKTLEEPSAHTTWILLSDRPREILPTILSRCTKLSFQEVNEGLKLGEEANRLRKLLEERPSYPKLALELEAIEKLIEGEDAPKKAHALLAIVAEHFGKAAAKHLEAHTRFEKPLRDAALALERNIKLSTCLEYVLLVNNNGLMLNKK